MSGKGLSPKFVPVFQQEEVKTIPRILEEVIETICSKYCKYPDLWDEEAEGIELCESDICVNCPLNRLV